MTREPRTAQDAAAKADQPATYTSTFDPHCPKCLHRRATLWPTLPMQWVERCHFRCPQRAR
jgi:hypothetical protein